MDQKNTTNHVITGTVLNPSVEPSKVVPLLQALSRLEELASGLTMRLDPITDHSKVTNQANQLSAPTTVTVRINQVGDVLQYLLDNIEL